MKKIIYLMTLLTLTFFGCYEDKGSYEYGDIKELIIEFPDFESSVNYGDRVVVDPKFNINIPEDAPYMSYRWSVRNNSSREGWNKRKLDWVADTIMGYNDLILEVKDNRTGLVFTHTERLSVKSIFDAQGWVVLSEIDGKSVMSLVKHKESDDNSYITEVEVFKDAYKTTNNEALGENPIGFQEHFSWEFGTTGQFIVFQDKPVDIDGLSFKKVLDISSIFTTGVLPAKIVNGSFMDIVDVLEDDKGQLYTRIKSSHKLFHSNYFLPKPIKFENEVLTQCKVIRARYSTSKLTLVHDQKKQRFLFLYDGRTTSSNDLKSAGEIKLFPEKPAFGDTPKKYFPLNNTSSYDVINITYAKVSGGAYRMIIREKSSGKYYYQYFSMNRVRNTTTSTFGNMNVVEIPGLDFEPDALCMQTDEDHNKYVFISKGDKLYMFDLSYPNTPLALYHDFGKDYTSPVKITSINGDAYENKRMGLGLDNGDFCIMRVEGAKNFTKPEEKIEIRLEPKDYLGRIIKVYRKIGGDTGGWS